MVKHAVQTFLSGFGPGGGGGGVVGGDGGFGLVEVGGVGWGVVFLLILGLPSVCIRSLGSSLGCRYLVVWDLVLMGGMRPVFSWFLWVGGLDRVLVRGSVVWV